MEHLLDGIHCVKYIGGKIDGSSGGSKQIYFDVGQLELVWPCEHFLLPFGCRWMYQEEKKQMDASTTKTCLSRKIQGMIGCKGYTQISVLYYLQTFALVANMNTIQIPLLLAALLG